MCLARRVQLSSPSTCATDPYVVFLLPPPQSAAFEGAPSGVFCRERQTTTRRPHQRTPCRRQAAAVAAGYAVTHTAHQTAAPAAGSSCAGAGRASTCQQHQAPHHPPLPSCWWHGQGLHGPQQAHGCLCSWTGAGGVLQKLYQGRSYAGAECDAAMNGPRATELVCCLNLRCLRRPTEASMLPP